MTAESRELSDLRRDTFLKESFLAGEQLPPKEVERAEDCEPYVRCKFCKNHCMPMAAVCVECWDGPEEE